MLLLAALLAGCGAARPRAAVPEPTAWPGTRPADGLLGRADLQRVVAAQQRRDGRALIPLLADEDPDVRARAALALASVQDTRAVPALIEALDDGDARVRADAAFALGQSADSAVAGALLEALDGEPDPAVVALMLEALGKTGGGPALRALSDLRVPPGRGPALAMALARFGMRGVHDPVATNRLLELLAEDHPETRVRAAYAFARPPDPSFWRAEARRLRTALDSLGPEDPAAAHLVTALGRLGDPTDTGMLTDVLAGAIDWRTRVNAARALASRSETPEAAEALLAALSDTSHHVRRSAAEALSAADSIPSGAGATIVAHLERLRDPAAGAALLPALLREGSEAAAIAWAERLPPDEVAGRTAALHGLALAGGAASFRFLEEALGAADARIAGAAAEGMAARWRTERAPERAAVFFPRLRDALMRGDVGTVTPAAAALGDTLFRPLGSVALLMDAYHDLRLPEHVGAVSAVLEALGRAGDPAAVPLLRDASRAGHPTVRAAAAEALERITGERPSSTTAAAGTAARSEVDWAALAALGSRPLLVLRTARGRIVIELSPEQAPMTVQTVAGIAERGGYDGVPFHRVVPNFVIQGGDTERGDGYAGPGFTIRSELTRIPYRRGTAGMASAGRDTEGSQFFIAHSAQPHLDGRYTAFGAVVEGMDVVDRIRPGDLVVRAYVVARD